MKRGRPSDNYPRKEFLRIIMDRRQFLKASLVSLADDIGMNRGYLSRILRGERPCPRAEREALFDVLGVTLADKERQLFFPKGVSQTNRVSTGPIVPLDPPISPHPPLERGQRFLFSGRFPEAVHEFTAVFKHSAEAQDRALQADAAARLAWVDYELGLYPKALEWVEIGVKLIETRVGEPLQRIMDSLRPLSNSSLCPPNDEASHVLSRLLQIRCKALVEQVVYFGAESLREKATKAAEQSIALDRHLQLPDALGYSLRWRAVLMASDMRSQAQDAESLLSESRSLMLRESAGNAYLARDTGIVLWRTEKHRDSETRLNDAVQRLAGYADAAALAPALNALSRVTLERGRDRRSARRYALAAAAFHPYKFVLRNAAECVHEASANGLRCDIDDLFSGAKPFHVLHPIISRLTDGSSSDAVARIRENLSRIRGIELPPADEIRPDAA
jgi:tetratricopeptide (TPR) repeat protein